jgi:uncharacterized protein YeaO (DUF488 family)
MRISFIEKYAAWKNVLDRHCVTLLCFCSNPSGCHRVVAATLLAEAGGIYEGEREEITD